MRSELHLRLYSSEPHGDGERLARLGRRLREYVLRQRFGNVTWSTTEGPPVAEQGSLSPDSNELVVTLDDAPVGLHEVLTMVSQWRKRQDDSGLVIRAEIGSSVLDLEQGSETEQGLMIDVFVSSYHAAEGHVRGKSRRSVSYDDLLLTQNWYSTGRRGHPVPGLKRPVEGQPRSRSSSDSNKNLEGTNAPAEEAADVGLQDAREQAANDPPSATDASTTDVPAGGTQPSTVDLNVAADMPSHLQLGEVVSVACHISREDLDEAADRVRDEGRVAADPSRPITLEILPKTNIEVVGDDRADVPVPDTAAVADLYFDVRPTNSGTCQVWVVVRQGPVPLLTLRLEAPATAEPYDLPIARHPVEAKVTVGETTGLDDGTWLSVVEMDRGPDTIYRFELWSTALNVLATFESPPLANRSRYVANLYREIESRWLTSEGDVEAFQEELREFGGSLLSQLFPEPLQEILWRLRGKLRDLIVLSCEPFVPWELVHLKEPGEPLPDETRFLAETGLVRWLYTRDNAYPPQILRARVGQVRVLCPDYPDPNLRLANTREEANFLITALAAEEVSPTERAVRSLLRSGDFDILHFAGHGLADNDDIANAKILLRGRTENGTYVRSTLSATTVEQQARLAGPDGGRPLVMLNACQAGRLGQQMSSLGGFAQAFLERGAGAFISSMWSVGDEPASSFVTTFYSELIRGEPLSTAATRARQVAREAGDGTWLAYAVYAHPQAHLLPSQSADATAIGGA